MKKFLFAFVLILLCLLPFTATASSEFSYSFENTDDAKMWFGGTFDDSNPFESGFSLYVNNPYGEVKNNHVTHTLDYSPTISLTAGKTYTLSGYVMNPLSGNSPSLRTYASLGAGSNTVLVSIDGIGDEWGYFSTTFFAGESGEYNLALHFHGGSIDFGLFVDEIKFEETSCVLSSLNINGPKEILIPATGSMKSYYRPFLLTSDNKVVDILSSSNLHFSVPSVKGISFNSRDFSLTVTSEATATTFPIGCTLRNFKELPPVSVTVALTSDIIENSDFSKDEILWESNSPINIHKDGDNHYISVPTNDYGASGYFATITYSKPQLLYEDVFYVIRAKVKSDDSVKLSHIYAKNNAQIDGTTLFFTVVDISDDEWVDVFAAFSPEASGIYDIAMNLCSPNDCVIYIDDIKLSCETLEPEYITLHAPGNITIPNVKTTYPFSALLRDQMGNIIPTEDIKIDISGSDSSFKFDSNNNCMTIYPDTTAGTYTLVATYLPDPTISATLDFTISFNYIGDGTFESTIPNEWWMVSSPYESSLYMRSDGFSRRAFINCSGNYFMLLNNSYVHLQKNQPYVLNASFSTATDCTGTLFIETLDNEILPLAQFLIEGGSSLNEKRLPELFLAEENAVGRLFFYFESNSGEAFTLYADDISLKVATVAAVNPHIIGTPHINSAVEADFILYNNVSQSDDNSSCFINWYVSNTINGVYEEIKTLEKNIYFDTTFLNKYVYFEVTPVCPITGFSGNPARSQSFLVTYDGIGSSYEESAFKPILDNEIVANMSFSDIDGHWGKEDIEILARSGIVNGKSQNCFMPNDSITRAEFAKMLSMAFSVNYSTELPLFEDVKSTSWYFTYVNSLHLIGIVRGTSDTRFSPNKTLTREEAVVMLIRLYEKALDTKAYEPYYSFTDEKSVSPWAISSVKKASALKLVKGNPNGSFSPGRNLTRGEATALIVRLANKLK